MEAAETLPFAVPLPPPAGQSGLASPTGRRTPTDTEAKALASAVRLRILRMCADTPMTNAAIAERLGLNAATALHHVRTLVASGFLEPMPSTRGRRGARTVPYRATRKSWVLDERRSARAMVEAFTQTLPVLLGDDDAPDRPAGAATAAGGVPDPELQVARLGLRLDDDGRAELQRRLDEVLDEFATRPPTPDGAPVSLFLALHRDPDRD